ncbi:hypothetical protein GQ600_12181 [Phytophthora cactorum]|nr:hypothetical protein GQ600_12181 [Phytophthora cactorum]
MVDLAWKAIFKLWSNRSNIRTACCRVLF